MSSRKKFPGEDDEDHLNPKSKSFCRACIDIKDFDKLNYPKGKKRSPDCPPDRVEIGQHAWSFLHTIAAYYPEKPSEIHKKAATDLIKSVSNLYPCLECAADFRFELAQQPVKVDSRNEFAGWLCVQHNIVNKKLGKKLFDCSKISERWRDGPPDGSCDV